MFRIDQDRLDQNKHDPEIQEYFHRVEYQNKLRLPHIAKTQFLEIFLIQTLSRTAGATKYIPMFSNMIPIPYPSISDSESMSAYCNNVSEVRSGVNASFTVSLNAGFSLS